MKKFQKQLGVVILGLAMVSLASCGGSSKGSTSQDTIYLESGVKYVYLKKGDGPKIDSLSEVVTHINLIVDNDTVWTTYGENNQKFTFYAKKTSLITGFDEVVMYAREGDRILAIIPPELGYGAQGSGNAVPPNATLQFDLDMLKVSAPKTFLSDVFMESYRAGGYEAAIVKYEEIKADSANYHLGNDEWYAIHTQVMNQRDYEGAMAMWEYRLAEGADLRGYFHLAQACEGAGNVDKAVEALEMAKEKLPNDPNQPVIEQYLTRLKGQ